MSNIDKQGRQVQRYANFGVDMMEWADGGYVKHSDYLALLDELEPMALAHLNLNLLCDVYRSAYEEARHDGLVNWEAASSLAEENEDLKRKLEAAEKRIAELEARTVIVPSVSDDAFWLNFNGRSVFLEETYRSAVFKALDSVGIKNAAGTAKGE